MRRGPSRVPTRTARRDALGELMDMIAAGTVCTQNAGDGPFVYAAGRSKLFSARTARRGERLGLLSLRWCTNERTWRWILTEKGWSTMKAAVVTAASR